MTPYQYGANNPILHVDVNGDSLKISNNSQAKEDIYSLVSEENRRFLSMGKNSSFVSVSLDFGNLSEKQIKKILRDDKGLKLLHDVISASERYLYEASELALLNDESGNAVGVMMLMDNNGIVNASANGRDSSGGLTYTPASGYDGHLVVSADGVWMENNRGNNVVKPRASIVFHELAENYERTTNGVDYGGHNGAHAIAIRREYSWKSRSSQPGSITAYSNPNKRNVIGPMLNYIFNEYKQKGFDLE
jgi:hypothetical protein